MQASQLPGLVALLEMCPKFQEQKREEFCGPQGVTGVLCTFEPGLLSRIKFSRERVVSRRDCHVQVGVLDLIAQHARYPGLSQGWKAAAGKEKSPALLPHGAGGRSPSLRETQENPGSPQVCLRSKDAFLTATQWLKKT